MSTVAMLSSITHYCRRKVMIAEFDFRNPLYTWAVLDGMSTHPVMTDSTVILKLCLNSHINASSLLLHASNDAFESRKNSFIDSDSLPLRVYSSV